MRKHHFLMIIQFTFLIYCMFFFISKFNTYAWFTSEIKASGQITNATTSDLLSISTNEISYQKNCTISQEIVIKNISNLNIPIQFIDQKEQLDPGETFKTTINQIVSCNETEINYHLVGLNHYIDEMIRVPLDQAKLLATVEMKQETNEIKEDPENNSIENTGTEDVENQDPVENNKQQLKQEDPNKDEEQEETSNL
ncbi:hypothetical protein ACQKP0_04380 [Heyndrickxia sp. NPDC080065]|uniref:hypothetical protein n=1 Tax=Heyndrickxia sp. NPDC080065 TaxID=3390568 RepID=UPI003D00EC73